MKWIALCLRNKLIIYVLTVVVCVVGFLALYTRPITPFPIIPLEKFRVLINYPGANAQTVQKQVTSEVVTQLQSISNIKYITAYSQAGAATILLELQSGTPLEKLQAHLDIVQAINAVHLPTIVPQPQVMMLAGTSGLIQFVVSANELSLFDLNNFIASRLVPAFSALPGVLIYRDLISDPVIKIKLKPDVLAQDQLDPSMIASMINTNYQSAPLGSLTVQGQQYFLNTLDDYDTLRVLGNLVVGYRASTNSGLPIYLKDIANISFEPRDIVDQLYSDFNGSTATSVSLNTQTDSNPFAISAATRAYVNSLKDSLPADMKITPIFDISHVMMASIKEVSFTIVSASILVLLVALVFLGRFKTTLIPIITIPVCLLGAVICIYQYLLGLVFKRARLSLSVVIVLVLLGSYYTLHLPQTIFPADPDGEIDITAQGSPSDDLNSLKHRMEQLASFYQDKKVMYYLISSQKDPETGMLNLQANLQYQDRYLKQLSGFSEQMNQYIKDHQIKNTYAKMQQFMNWSWDYDINFYIYGSGNAQSLNATAQEITAVLEKSPLFSLAGNNVNLPQKQLAFDIDAVKAQKLGITRTQILNLLSTVFGGAQMNDNFSIAGLSVPIVLQLDTPDLKDPASFQKLMIQSPLTNAVYLLSDFVTLKTIAKPLGITTFNNQTAVRIGVNLNKGYDMASGINWINHMMRTQESMVQYQYAGQAEQFLENNNESLIIALLGILSVYFLLTILFKSLIDPFIIMLTVPFSVVGGALSLYLIGGSLNLFSTLGLITLVGLITKHGVLIVQFANHELKKGVSVIETALLATRHRFRPIIMTTLAMILGALPLMVSSDIMYVSRQNLAIVIMSGLAVGTLFSLFIVPLVYVLVKRQKKS